MCLSESPASSDLEDCAGQTTASMVEGVNLEDCTKPLKQTSAGCGLERSDSSDTVSQPRSVCGTPETPKERVP